MPEKKTDPNGNGSILIAEIKLIYAERANNQQLLELCLTKLMKLANEHYDAVYLKYKNNPDIEKFSFCKENFQKIKSIIEAKEPEITSQLIKKFHLEAWVSTLYSDVHALNLDPETEDQLNELNKKIQAIETDFNQLLTEISSLDSNDTGSARLLNYIDGFRKTWETNKNMLKGHYYYNFAETLAEKANEELETNKCTLLEDAKHYFMQSADFYKQANLLEFEAQTKGRINKLELTSKELLDSSTTTHYKDIPLKKLVLVLTKLSPSFENKGIKTESLWTASYREASDKLTEVVDQPILPQLIAKKIDKSDEIRSTRRKRKPFDNDIKPAKKIRCETECTKLLNEFEQIGIEKYYLSDPSRENELIRYKASLASKFALDIIENLIFPNKSLSDTEKLYRLKEAQNGFSKSIAFYSQAGLLKEKGKAIECSNLLASTIEELNGLLNKKSIKHPNSSNNKKPSFDKQIVSTGKFDSPTRYTRTFFKNLSCPENNAIKVDNQPILDNGLDYSP